MHIKRIFLVTLIVCFSIAALMGLSALFFGTVFGTMEWRLLSSMLLIAVASGLALASTDAMDKGFNRRLSITSLLLIAIGLLMCLTSIWLLSFMNLSDDVSKLIAKVIGVVVAWAVVLPLAAQISVIHIKGPMTRLKPLTLILFLLVAGMITAALLGEIGSELYYRLLAADAILAILGAMILRITQRIQGLDKVTSSETTALELQITCPRCLLSQTVQSGHSRCHQCKLKFNIEIEEPRCPKCGYLLHQLTTPRCPECGEALCDEDVIAAPVPAVSVDVNPS